MVFKINIGEKSGKTYKLESEEDSFIDKKLHDVIKGEDFSKNLEGYEFEITGASDKAGFTAMEQAPGVGLKKLLLSYGKGMKKRPRREGKKKFSNSKPKGLKLRKTVRGNTLTTDFTQINLKVIKEGKKKLEEIFNPKVEEAAESKKE